MTDRNQRDDEQRRHPGEVDEQDIHENPARGYSSIHYNYQRDVPFDRGSRLNREYYDSDYRARQNRNLLERSGNEHREQRAERRTERGRRAGEPGLPRQRYSPNDGLNDYRTRSTRRKGPEAMEMDWERDQVEGSWRYDFQGEEYAPEFVYSETWGDAGPYTGMGPRNYQRSDERILEDVCERLSDHGHLDASQIEVRVVDGEVKLLGSVRSRGDKWLAEDVSASVPGVERVENFLRTGKYHGGAQENQEGSS